MATYNINGSVSCNYYFTIEAASAAEAEEVANEYLANNYLVMDCDGSEVVINSVDKE